MQKLKNLKKIIVDYLYNKFHKDSYTLKIDHLLGHPEVIKQVKAAGKIFEEMRDEIKEQRINKAKQNKHILKKHFGKDIHNKDFYERDDVIEFIMTSYHFDSTQRSSGGYNSGYSRSHDDDNHHSSSNSSGSSSNDD